MRRSHRFSRWLSRCTSNLARLLRPPEVNPIEGRPEVRPSGVFVAGLVPEAAPVPPLRILVVDDNVLMRRVLHAQLHNLGYPNVAIVCSGSEAVALLSDPQRYGAFDVVLTDLFMPEVDGYQTSEWIVRHFQNAKLQRPHIIVISGNDMPDSLVSLAQIGIDVFVRKPTEVTSLGVILRKLRPVTFEGCYAPAETAAPSTPSAAAAIAVPASPRLPRVDTALHLIAEEEEEEEEAQEEAQEEEEEEQEQEEEDIRQSTDDHDRSRQSTDDYQRGSIDEYQHRQSTDDYQRGSIDDHQQLPLNDLVVSS